MDILAFFSDLILFTAGLFVLLFWIIIVVFIWLEIFDTIREAFSKEEEELY